MEEKVKMLVENGRTDAYSFLFSISVFPVPPHSLLYLPYIHYHSHYPLIFFFAHLSFSCFVFFFQVWFLWMRYEFCFFVGNNESWVKKSYTLFWQRKQIESKGKHPFLEIISHSLQLFSSFFFFPIEPTNKRKVKAFNSTIFFFKITIMGNHMKRIRRSNFFF